MSFARASGFEVPCPYCQRPRRVNREVNLDGQVVESIDPCLRCARGRKSAGICQDCSAPVEGRRGWALRCARHKKAARQRQEREFRARNRDKRNALWRERYHAEDAGARARRRARKRAWRQAHPEKVQGYRIRYALRHPDKVIALWDRHNNEHRPERAAMKRQYAHEHYTRYAHSEPACERCGAVVPWSRRGRPARLCRTCDPKRWEQQAARAAKRAA